jgi:FkbM family methyltransferase
MNIVSLIPKFCLNINGVIHIGAHYGQEYDSYIQAKIRNMIFFEPLKDNFKILLNNIKLSDDIKAYNIALGNVMGEIDMFIETANKGMSSSILEPEEHIIKYPTIVFNNKETVLIDKLDNILYDRDKFNFINIDVQGYELEVLKGAINSLKYVDCIMTEINKVHLYKEGVLEDELDSFLFNLNFVRVETEWNGDIWGDALYIKNKFNE